MVKGFLEKYAIAFWKEGKIESDVVVVVVGVELYLKVFLFD